MKSRRVMSISNPLEWEHSVSYGESCILSYSSPDVYIPQSSPPWTPFLPVVVALCYTLRFSSTSTSPPPFALRDFTTHQTNLGSSAKDQLSGTSVAIKKIMKPFSTPVLSKRTYRELKLLKHLRHENVSETGRRTSAVLGWRVAQKRVLPAVAKI